MKRRFRINFFSRIWILGFFVAAFLVVMWCVDMSDDSAYFESDYYRSTMETLERIKNSIPTSNATLEAGVAKVSITPNIQGDVVDLEKGIFPQNPLAGYGDRKGTPADGVLDTLFVKAIWLKSGNMEAAIISLDMLIPPEDMVDTFRAEVSSKLGLPPKNCYFTSTHTHSGPGGWMEGWIGEAFAGPHEPGMNAWLKDRVFECLAKAKTTLKPVTVAYQEGILPDLVQNRLVGDKGMTDARLQSIFLKPEQEPVITLGIFAAHPTLMGADSLKYCGDYPGHWQSSVEESTGGYAIFLAGGMGSHSTSIEFTDHDSITDMSHPMATMTLQHLEDAEFNQTNAFAADELTVDLPEPHLRASDHTRIRPWLAGKLLPLDTQTRIHAMRIGDILLLGTPCDFSGELSLTIANHFNRSGFHAVVTSFNGDYIGYVVPQKYYHYRHYETRVMSFFGPNNGPYLTDMIQRLGQAVVNASSN